MKKMFILMIGLSAMLASCNPKTTTPPQPETDTTAATQKMVGNDVDEHGCKGSAGYTWSAALQGCIRIWEKGIEMKSVEKKDTTSATYLVFSTDTVQVELFIPGHENHALLERMHPVSNPKQYVWSSDKASNGLKVYQEKTKLWVIEQDGKVQYRQISQK